MENLIISLFFNLGLVLLIVGVVAFFLTWVLNPTASAKEIFTHWKNVYSCKSN